MEDKDTNEPQGYSLIPALDTLVGDPHSFKSHNLLAEREFLLKDIARKYTISMPLKVTALFIASSGASLLLFIRRGGGKWLQDVIAIWVTFSILIGIATILAWLVWIGNLQRWICEYQLWAEGHYKMLHIQHFLRNHPEMKPKGALH